MILSGVLRRASSSAFLPAGATLSRSFHIHRSSLDNPRSLISKRNLESRPFIAVPVYNFSSNAGKPSLDADLLRVIDTEIKCAEECDDYDRVEEIPEGFPFKIQNEKGKSTITLRRRYFGEDIEVLVSMPSLVTGEEPELDRSAEEGEKGRPAQSSIPLTINFSKNEGRGLEFCCTAYPDELVIDSMSFKEIKESEEMLSYQGPNFSDLAENLQKSWYKYLEVRGISAMTTNFLHEYMMNKDSLEYLLWLRDLKKLIEK